MTLRRLGHVRSFREGGYTYHKVEGVISRGGDSYIKMPGCVCWVSENGPILNDSISCKTWPYCRDPLHNSYPFSMVILS